MCQTHELNSYRCKKTKVKSAKSCQVSGPACIPGNKYPSYYFRKKPDSVQNKNDS